MTSDGEEFEEPVLYVKGTFVGTAHYVSPEILKDLPQSECSDIWALGCILYHFLTGRQLFDGESQYLIFQKITAVQEEGLFIEDEEDLDSDAVDFIRQVCQFDAEKRLGSRQRGGMSELKKHPFFKGIDFSQLGQETPPLINSKYPGPNLSHLNGASNHLLHINNGNNGSSSLTITTTPSSPNSPFRRTNGHIRSLSSSSESSSSTGSSSSGQIVIDGYLRRTVSGGSELTESLNDRWSKFLMKNENVVYTALVIKRRRFTAKKRQLILTDKPRILYIDPEKMLLKGIIPWSNELYVVKKNSREFTIQTVSTSWIIMIEWKYFVMNGIHGLKFRYEWNSIFVGNLLEFIEFCEFVKKFEIYYEFFKFFGLRNLIHVKQPGRNYQLEDLSNGVDAWYDHIEGIKEQMKSNK